VKWRHFRVTSSRARSHFTFCHVTATSCELQPLGAQKFTKPQFLAFYSHFQVTSGEITSIPGHGTSFHVTWLPPNASYSNVGAQTYSKPEIFHVLQPLPGNFRWNDVTSGSLPVVPGYATSFPVMWLPPPLSYNPVRAQMYTKPQFSAFYSHFQVTSSEMSLPGHFRSRQFTWCHFLSRDCHLLRVTAL